MRSVKDEGRKCFLELSVGFIFIIIYRCNVSGLNCRRKLFPLSNEFRIRSLTSKRLQHRKYYLVVKLLHGPQIQFTGKCHFTNQFLTSYVFVVLG